MPLSGSWRIYENDPARVPPLVIQRKQFLDRKRYPFYLHTDGVLLVVRREGVQNLSYLAQVVVLTGSAQFCQSATIKRPNQVWRKNRAAARSAKHVFVMKSFISSCYIGCFASY